ncbi:MAG: hypothetical protein M4579_007117 [Chaenotheca gracillima]|nr:MAG: hypothetical protein M4579_007117 [Chaenotheca gracillima]
MEGVFPATSLMDTVGIFTRSPTLLGEVGAVTKSPRFVAHRLTAKPRYRLLYPTRGPRDGLRWFPRPGESGEAIDAERIMEDSVKQIESCLGCQRQVFNLDELWTQTRPQGQPETLDEAVGKIYSIITTYTSTRDRIASFLTDHQARKDGRAPFIDPLVLSRHRFGREQTRESYEAAVHAGAAFSGWVRDVLFVTEDADETPLLIFPQSFGIPRYRDTLDPSATIWTTFSIYSFGYLAGCPDYTLPIGEVGYASRISEREEFLPVSLSIVGAPSHDLTLFGILNRLAEDGVLKDVITGPHTFLTTPVPE